MNDMMKLYHMGGDLPVEETLLVNTASPLTAKLASLLDAGEEERAGVLARQIYRLASLSQRQLTADEMVSFLTDSYVHHSQDGWDYVEHFSLENGVSTCNVWICTGEDGSRQILVIYPTFVQGYKLGPAE